LTSIPVQFHFLATSLGGNWREAICFPIVRVSVCPECLLTRYVQNAWMDFHKIFSNDAV